MQLREVCRMLNVIAFEIPGPIKGKARPRVTRAGIAYTPKETVQYENLVKLCFREAAASGTVDLFDKPLRAQLEVYHEIPKSTSKSRKGAMLLDRIYPTKKPDADNIAKIVLDSLNGIAYKDDSQVVELIVNKSYSKRGQPYVFVRLSPMPEGRLEP